MNLGKSPEIISGERKAWKFIVHKITNNERVIITLNYWDWRAVADAGTEQGRPGGCISVHFQLFHVCLFIF